MQKILLIEDDITLSNGIRLALQNPSLLMTLCYTMAEAQAVLEQERFDLLILDINLPDGSGLDLLNKVRKVSTVPIILLTANDMEMDIVTGLESGADDYITKPFSLSVLRARVNTQLRKKTTIHQNAPIHIDHFCFDFGTMTFYVRDAKVELSKTEQKLLHLLVENRGRTMTRGDLVDRIWTDGAEYVDENALSVTVKRLRDTYRFFHGGTRLWRFYRQKT